MLKIYVMVVFSVIAMLISIVIFIAIISELSKSSNNKVDVTNKEQ